MKHPDYRNVQYFVTGMVVDYWKTALQQPLHGENFERYLADSITKVWAYVTTDRSTANFTDLQCVIAAEARNVFCPALVPA